MLARVHHLYSTTSRYRLHETLTALLLPPYLYSPLLPTHLTGAHPAHDWLDDCFFLRLRLRLWLKLRRQLGITRQHRAELPLRFPGNDRIYRPRCRLRPNHPHPPASVDMETPNADHEEDPGLWYLPVGEFRGCSRADAHGDLHTTKHTVKYVSRSLITLNYD